jgi:chromosomal replication initiator protein
VDNLLTTPGPRLEDPAPEEHPDARPARPEAPEIWTRALALFQETVPSGMFDAWIAQVRGVAYEGGRFTIEVPNAWLQSGIRERHVAMIEETLGRVTGSRVSLDITVGTEPRPRAPEGGSAGDAPGVANGNGGAHGAPPAHGYEAPSPSIQLNPRYTFANFVVGRSNEFAHAAALAVSKRAPIQYNPLFIYGGVGLGKSHLVQAIAHAVLEKNPAARVLYLSAETWMNEMIAALQNKTILAFKEKFRSADYFLLDDIQFFAGKESTQEELFHTFNSLLDANKRIVLASDRPAHQIEQLEERLISRFQAGLVADIQTPDFETRLAILRNRSAAEGIPLSDDVSLVVASCVKNNVRELEGSLTRLLAYASLTGNEITSDLARQVLKEYLSQPSRRVSIDQIQDVVVQFYGLPGDAMRSRRRTAAIANARQIAMFIAREMTGLSLSEIGKRFGGRDHTTVLHAVEKVKLDAERDPTVADAIARLKKQIETR